MTGRGKGPRPVGTDGTDHEYRMLIEGRYKQLAKQRRELEAITLYMVAATGAICVWRASSYFFDGSATLMEVLAQLAWSIFRTALYLYGSGFGKAHKENMQVLKTYRTMHWLYLIQALRDASIQAIMMYNKMAVGSKVSMDGILDLTHPSAGSNFLLLFLDLGELLCIVASYRCLSKYVTLKTTKPGEKEK